MSELLKRLETLATNGPLPEQELRDLDELMQVSRMRRLALDRESKVLKATEDSCNALLIDQLMKHTKSFVSGDYIIKVGPPEYVPHVDNWDKFYKHIIAMEDFSLLEKRVGRAAVQERWDSGAIVPGVERYPVYKLFKEKVKK